MALLWFDPPSGQRFFFPSGRRHTRFDCDWSSDVCSSDLFAARSGAEGMRLNGQHALVTGGGTGIGAAIADALLNEGAAITLLGRRLEKLEETGIRLRSSRAKSRGAGTEAEMRPSTTLGTSDAVFCAAADVTDLGQVDAAFAAARAAHGPISILIPNAGAAESAPFAKTDIDLLQRMLAVNLDGVFHCCQAALPDLVAAERGRIVAIASTAS